MIHIDKIKELIKIVLYSGYVSGEKPLSLFMVGKVGIGKSEILKLFKIVDNIAFFSDITYMGLIELLKDNKQVRHIIIPDFLKITMKKASTTNNVISCLNSLIEEGLYKISLFGVSENFKGKRAGLIAATTKSSYYQHKKQWENMGLVSRMLMVSFDYSQETIEEIFSYIHNRGYLMERNEVMEMPIKNKEVHLPPELAQKLRDTDTNFRTQKQLQTLALSVALIDDKTTVEQSHIDKVIEMKEYINLNFKTL